MNTQFKLCRTGLLICAALGAAAANAANLTYPIVDTNQNSCVGTKNALAGCPQPGDDTYGQDAQYMGNQPDYQRNGDGTVTDKVTGLMWTDTTDTNGDGEINAADKMTWDEAMTWAENLNKAGHSDWRLPTIKELYSLILFDAEDPSRIMASSGTFSMTPFINIDYFAFNGGDMDAGERLIDSQYATSTKYVSTTMKGAETMFGVNFIDGRIKGYGLESPRGDEKTFYVLAVRGNPEYGINDFSAAVNGTVTDNATGLTWQQGDSGENMDFPSALGYCENLTLNGNSDWRLPNVKELQSIVDYTRSPDTTGSAAIDPVFDSTPITNEAGQKDYASYWSSTTHMDSESTRAGAYVSFGRSMGKMNGEWMDVHGAGAQRSDDKTGDPSRFSDGRGPQGDAVRINNMVRCVTGGEAEFVAEPTGTSRGQFTVELSGEQNTQPGAANRQAHTQGQQKGDRQMPPRGGKDPFSMLDRNGDGKISKAEAKGPLARDFSKLDKNGDGYLSEGEVPPPPGRK